LSVIVLILLSILPPVSPDVSAICLAQATSTITSEIAPHVQAFTERYYRRREVLQTLDEPLTVAGLAAEPVLDTDVAHGRPADCSLFDPVGRGGDTVRPVE
jgi:hypothetical protein